MGKHIPGKMKSTGEEAWEEAGKRKHFRPEKGENMLARMVRDRGWRKCKQK